MKPSQQEIESLLYQALCAHNHYEREDLLELIDSLANRLREITDGLEREYSQDVKRAE